MYSYIFVHILKHIYMSEGALMKREYLYVAHLLSSSEFIPLPLSITATVGFGAFRYCTECINMYQNSSGQVKSDSI